MKNKILFKDVKDMHYFFYPDEPELIHLKISTLSPDGLNALTLETNGAFLAECVEDFLVVPCNIKGEPF